ncbi:hypothetical protein MAJ_02278, partial [Metarhizium majus ARSEF 297]
MLELASQDDARRASIQPAHSGPAILKGHSQLISSQYWERERDFFLYRGLLDCNACVAVETSSPMAKHQAFPNFYNPITRTSALYFALNLVPYHDTGPQIEYSSPSPHFKRRRRRRRHR